MSNEITMSRALALIQLSNVRTLGEYTATAEALAQEGYTREQIEEAMDTRVQTDVEAAVEYLYDKVERLAAEKEETSGLPVKTFEVDWYSIEAVVPITDPDGSPLPTSLLNGAWIANGYIAQLLKIEKGLSA